MSSNGDNVYSQGSVLKVDDRTLVQINNTVFKNNSFNHRVKIQGAAHSIYLVLFRKIGISFLKI